MYVKFMSLRDNGILLHKTNLKIISHFIFSAFRILYDNNGHGDYHTEATVFF